jgi:hypothetical protein
LPEINFLILKIMRKIMKSFMAMALGLSLVLAGCSKDDDNGSSFEGNYDAVVNVTGAPAQVPEISTTLALTKEGANYQAAANLSTFGSLSLLLTSVTEVINAGEIVTYSFVVAEQTLNVTGVGNIPVSGVGTLGSVTILGETTYSISMTLIAPMTMGDNILNISINIAGSK